MIVFLALNNVGMVRCDWMCSVISLLVSQYARFMGKSNTIAIAILEILVQLFCEHDSMCAVSILSGDKVSSISMFHLLKHLHVSIRPWGFAFMSSVFCF